MNALMIRLSHTFDEEEFVRANHAMWWQRRRSPRNRYLGLAFLAALPLAAWLAAARGMYFTFFAVLGVNLLHWVFDWPLTRAIVRRRFRDMPSAGQRLEWEIGPEALRVRADDGEGGTFSWAEVRRAWEAPHGFVLARDGNITHWLPRQAFTSEEDVARFRQWMVEKVPGATAQDATSPRKGGEHSGQGEAR